MVEAALRLFSVHGVSGTSLQMIADETGVTKAALYYHYRTKDDLVLGVITPFLDRLLDAVEDARRRRGWRAQADAVLVALVDMIVDVRHLYTLVATDPSVPPLLAAHPRLEHVSSELTALLAGPGPDDERRASVAFFLAGLTGPFADPAGRRISDERLNALLVGTGRRLLLARSRTAAGAAPGTA